LARDGARVETLEAFNAAVVAGKNSVRQGKPYIINAIIGKTDFRKDSVRCNGLSLLRFQKACEHDQSLKTA